MNNYSDNEYFEKENYIYRRFMFIFRIYIYKYYFIYIYTYNISNLSV